MHHPGGSFAGLCAPAKMPSTLAMARMVSSASLCPISITRSTLSAPASHSQKGSRHVKLLHRTGFARRLGLTCCLRLPSCWQCNLSHLASILIPPAAFVQWTLSGALREAMVAGCCPVAIGESCGALPANTGRNAQQPLFSAGSRHLKDLWKVSLWPLPDASDGRPLLTGAVQSSGCLGSSPSGTCSHP